MKLLLVILILFVGSWARGESLEQQITNAARQRSGDVLILKVKSGEVLACSDRELFFHSKYPPGSLVKIFTAMAFFNQHGNRFPTLNCPATSSKDNEGCWDRNGHGRIDIVRAIAHSCNVYFRQLAHDVSADQFRRVLTAYGLRSAPINDDEANQLERLMVGNTNEWRVAPITMLRAYCAIYNNGHLFPFASEKEGNVFLSPVLFPLIRNGMGLSSAEGTSIEARKTATVPVLGKTGTSLLVAKGQTDWRNTQGWWIGLYPVQQPEIAVMTTVPKGRGATDAAPLGGEALRLYLAGTKRLR